MIHFPHLKPLLSEQNPLYKFVEMATTTAWNMVTMQPPMIAMCPSATVAQLDPTIHEKKEITWDKNVKGDVSLVYQRPILYTSFSQSQPEVLALVVHATPEWQRHKYNRDHKTIMPVHKAYRASEVDGITFIGGDERDKTDDYDEDDDL